MLTVVDRRKAKDLSYSHKTYVFEGNSDTHFLLTCFLVGSMYPFCHKI